LLLKVYGVYDEIANISGHYQTNDDIGNNIISSLFSYITLDKENPMFFKAGEKYEEIKQIVKQRIVEIYIKNVKEHKKISIIAHSLGGQIAYEVLQELSYEYPLIHIDKFITLAPAINTFYQKTNINDKFIKNKYLSNVSEWYNLFSSKDELGIVGFNKPTSIDERIVNIDTLASHGGMTTDLKTYDWLYEIYNENK